MNDKITQLDPDQITRYSYDEENKASRVVLVNGLTHTSNSNINEIKVPEIIKQTEFKDIPVIIKQTEVIEIPKIVYEVKEIRVPEIVKEVVTIEKLVPVERLVIERIEIPVIIKEIELREVEKPIYIEKDTKIFRLVTTSLFLLNVCLLLINILK